MRTFLTLAAILALASADLALAHGDPLPSREAGELLLIGLLFATGAWYVAGFARVWRVSAGGRRTLARSGAMFAAGWFAIAASLLSPLHELGSRSFTAHMLEHELLMLLSAPLIAFSRPIGILLWALPHRLRLALGRTAHAGWFSTSWKAISSPLSASLIQAAMLWLWHAPLFFDRALVSEGWHAAQHLSLMFSALLFWWSINTASAVERRHGVAGFFLFFTSLHSGLLGALMAFAQSPWYPQYAAMGMSGTAGLTPLEDQQIAGLIMWIPGGAIHAIAALVYVSRWFRPSRKAIAAAVLAYMTIASTPFHSAGEFGLAASARADAPRRELRVCADPNNLPFANKQRQGFENRIVDIVARELHATVSYVWWAQRRGNIRHYRQCSRLHGVRGPREIIEDVANRKLDVAAVWGPPSRDISLRCRRRRSRSSP